MPAAQISTQPKTDYVIGIVKKYMEIEHMSQDRLSARLHITPNTLRNKLAKGTEFTYGELFECFRLLRVPPEEILQCFCIRREKLWGCEDSA